MGSEMNLWTTLFEGCGDETAVYIQCGFDFWLWKHMELVSENGAVEEDQSMILLIGREGAGGWMPTSSGSRQTILFLRTNCFHLASIWLLTT